MHVGFNLIYLVPGETGGTETYARELIPELVRAAPETRFTAFVNRETNGSDGPWSEQIRSVLVPVSARRRTEWVRGEQQLLPRLAAAHDVDLVHSLANTAPAWGRSRRVTTIHDLHFKRVPEAHLGLAAVGMRIAVPLAARRSHRLIVPAASTATDLHDVLGVRADKVDLVPEGLGARARTAPLPETELRERLGAGQRPIVLSVSAKRPHKNLARVIQALALIEPAQRPLLVVPGYPTPYEEMLRRETRALGLTDDVRLLGWVAPDELEGLYAASRLLVCASLHEGFGLPVLEAMARGLPVACSGQGALAEVAGEAALTFDPRSVEEIARAIRRLLDDPDTRGRLRESGLRRAQHYTWTATAAGTLASYERALRVPA